jgi:hypothetical protein
VVGFESPWHQKLVQKLENKFYNYFGIFWEDSTHHCAMLQSMITCFYSVFIMM